MFDRRQIVAGLAGATTLAAPTVLRAQTAWDMPVPYTDGTFHTQNVRWWVEEISKATGGSMKIQVHSNNSLIRLPEILRAVSTGQVAAGEILISQFGNEDPFFELDSIPFLAQGLDQGMLLYQASKQALESTCQRRGIRVLYCVAWPSQAFYSKTPINSAADMRGMKFRTVSPITSRMAELLGAVPTLVQASEVPQAFATNIVTGMITSGATGVQSRAWEFSSQFVNLRASMPKNAVLVNERAWQRLPQAVKDAMLAASAQAEPRGWKLAGEVEAASIEELRKNGMTVVDPSPQLLADVKAVGAKLTDEWIAKAGDTGKAVIENFRARLRA
ncbi:C4-dicarboxylate-binding periplasmic protein precursor [bacterium YEK0313]|nr:C4-dicarboxylate-binding periplasmic protein precursor [bacterium YEK0313]